MYFYIFFFLGNKFLFFPEKKLTNLLSGQYSFYVYPSNGVGYQSNNKKTVEKFNLTYFEIAYFSKMKNYSNYEYVKSHFDEYMIMLRINELFNASKISMPNKNSKISKNKRKMSSMIFYFFIFNFKKIKNHTRHYFPPIFDLKRQPNYFLFSSFFKNFKINCSTEVERDRKLFFDFLLKKKNLNTFSNQLNFFPEKGSKKKLDGFLFQIDKQEVIYEKNDLTTTLRKDFCKTKNFLKRNKKFSSFTDLLDVNAKKNDFQSDKESVFITKNSNLIKNPNSFLNDKNIFFGLIHKNLFEYDSSFFHKENYFSLKNFFSLPNKLSSYQEENFFSEKQLLLFLFDSSRKKQVKKTMKANNFFFSNVNNFVYI